jgi:hypothetical protein
MRVYRQLEPVPTGESAKMRSPEGEDYDIFWHKPMLQLVGEAKTFAEAKLLDPAPIMEAVPAAMPMLRARAFKQRTKQG